MTIIEALQQLRDDLRSWISTNLSTKLNKHMGVANSGNLLVINNDGNIEPKNLTYIDNKINEAVQDLDLSKIGITFGTGDLTDGSSTLSSGTIYFVLADD